MFTACLLPSCDLLASRSGVLFTSLVEVVAGE